MELVINHWTLYILYIFIWKYANATPIDNGVQGQPEVSCQQESAKITVHVEKPFYGHVYVKGQYRMPECHLDLTEGFPQGAPPPQAEGFNSYMQRAGQSSYAGQDLKTVEFYVSYRSCYVKRERSINPPGLSYSATVVVQFHRLFSTKVDRAYSVTCFYMESQKSVTYNFDVSMLSSVEIYQTRAMPICTYEVRRHTVTGPAVKFAQVGEQVYHKWTCNGGEDIYGMLVHSCVALDGSGTEYRLIDQTGCAIDSIAVADLTYTQDLLTAYVEVHVFKFADRMQVSFQCQVSLCLKLENGCRSISPPLCPQPQHSYRSTSRELASPPSSTPPYEGSASPTLYGNRDSVYHMTLQAPPPATVAFPYNYHRLPLQLRTPYQKASRNARKVADERNVQGTMDLTTDDIFIFNLDDRLPAELIASRNGSKLSGWSSTDDPADQNRLCLSSFGLTQIIFAIILSFCILTAAMIYCQRRYYIRRSNVGNPGNS